MGRDVSDGYSINTSQVEATVQQLEELNTSFMQKVQQLQDQETALDGMWEGSAKQAFVQAFNSDVEQMGKFSQLIGSYADALNSIVQAIKEAENKGISIGTTRNYR